MQALITVCAVGWSSVLNILPLACVILVANFFYLFPIVKLSDFVLLNYLATTFLNLVTVFSLKVAKWLFFFDFEPCRRNYMSRKMMQQWGSYCLQ